MNSRHDYRDTELCTISDYVVWVLNRIVPLRRFFLTQEINNKNNQEKKYRLGTVSKNILLDGLNRFHGANLTLSSDVDQGTLMFGLHQKPQTYSCIIS